jgi:hypothetical protein
VPTGGPGPVATIRPGGSTGTDGSTDDGSAVVWAIVGIVAIVLVAGLVFVARGLSRGNPLMAGAQGAESPGADAADFEAGGLEPPPEPMDSAGPGEPPPPPTSA